MSGGGTEYRLISHVRLMVLPAFTKTADSPSNLALAAENGKHSSHSTRSLLSRSSLTKRSAASHKGVVDCISLDLERLGRTI